jgi:hypothetical protein
MSNHKHTAGPWKAEGYDVRQPSGRYVAFTGPHHTEPSVYPPACKIEDEANARLIAAAPDLLEALESAAKWIDLRQRDKRFGRDVLAELRAVIAKAKGGGE